MASSDDKRAASSDVRRAAINEDERAVSNSFLPVDLGDLALPTLVLPAYDPDLIIFTNRQRASLVRYTIEYNAEAQIKRARTLCLPRSSFERAEDIILRRMEEGAEKCALRDLRREEEVSALRGTWSARLD